MKSTMQAINHQKGMVTSDVLCQQEVKSMAKQTKKLSIQELGTELYKSVCEFINKIFQPAVTARIGNTPAPLI